MDVKPCILASGVPHGQFLLRTGQLFNLRRDWPGTALGKKVRGLEMRLDTEVFVSPLSRHGSCQDHAYARGGEIAMRCQRERSSACLLIATNQPVLEAGAS